MKVTIWENKDSDLVSDGNPYMILLIKTDITHKLIRDDVYFRKFKIGQQYKEIGNKRFKGAGYAHYEGEPLVFIGCYEGHLLFEKVKHPHPPEGYKAFYYCFQILTNDSLCIINRSSSVRVITLK